jgi:hypothetical protein
MVVADKEWQNRRREPSPIVPEATEVAGNIAQTSQTPPNGSLPAQQNANNLVVAEDRW